MIRLAVTLLLGWPLAGMGAWQTLDESPEGLRLIDPARVEARGGALHFHERLLLTAGKIDPASLRPMREVLERRVLDCGTRRVATLSRAVFSDQDALIEHRAAPYAQLKASDWRVLPADDPRVRLLCRRP
ncbi:MAG TPA: hypothetical protein PKV42_11665 [Thiobacillus sp.]|uniref:hypothetical protein n=1 Tax=Polaromonas sp. TaxID=1869339 RepID=UPI000BD58ED2|nr:hypothetical protein [Polaromonas sp.]OYW62968.1 MAG: hypothetical protein B7Z32_13325 [Hydrogenophilales bacterium 12-64-13]OYZ04054.1 MAG: hypothetical protein B7Y26_13665 [Hydrogenophilales bacterium 16-64-46]OZA36693.1 MAG: hypothetical protein B7X87_13820 [Hydrogenophilales bacterium 17-64-34]HQS83104.1 hypothetical protein [Thiobacillus sp.]HQS89342.1 hypothetical protein [Polaromonas sp.]